MVPHPRWLDSLTAEFSDENVGVATGPVLALGLQDGSDVDLQLAVELAPRGSHRFQVDQRSRQWFERTNFGGVGDGNFALRRSAFNQMCGFDERLGRGAPIDSSEEHYAFFKAVELGFKVAYTPNAIVFHPRSPISNGILQKRISETVAFASFLAWNNPSKIWRVAKFLVGGILGLRRWWHSSSKDEMISISTKEKLAAGMNGLSIFGNSLRRKRSDISAKV
jgi:hypothetical protein